MEVRSIVQSRTWGLPLFGLLISIAVLLCLLIALPSWFVPQVRLWVSFILLLLLPGAPLVFLALRRELDSFEKIAASFVGSLVVLTAVGLLSHVFSWKLKGVLWSVPIVTVLLGLAQWWFFRSVESSESVRADTGSVTDSIDSSPPRIVRIVTWALLALAVVWSSTLSGEMGLTKDSLDHIATIREIRDTGELFPLTTSYIQAESSHPDPRKGLFHVDLAALCCFSGQDPVDVWIWLPRALLPLVLLIVFCFGRTLTSSYTGGWVASIFWLLCFGGPRSGLPIQVGYAHNVTEAVSWVLTILLIKYVVGGRGRLILASALGLVASCFVHVSAFVFVMAAWGCFFAAVLVIGGRKRRELSLRLGRAGLVWGGLGLLATAAKILMSYAPANPVHLQSQNLFYWTSSLYTINPLWIYRWFGFPGILSVVLALGLAFRSRDNPGRLYLIGASLVPVAIVLNPLLVPPLYSIVRYLIERLAWVVPYPHVLAFVAVACYRRVLAPGGLLARLGAGGLIIGIVGSVVLTAASRPDLKRIDPDRPVAWKTALDYLQSNVDTSSVVASDIITSYSIPAFTKHHIVSTLHMHGSPNDSRGLERMVALIEIMNPDLPLQELKHRLLEYEVDFLLVNKPFDQKVLLQYAEVDPGSLERLKERLSRHPEVFRRVYELEDLVLFAVDHEALGEWNPEDREPPPYILPPGRSPPGRPIHTVFEEQVELLSVELPQKVVQTGQTFEIVCYWQSRVEKLEFDIPWVVQVRIQRDYPKGRLYSPAYSKIYRRGLELLTKENYRFREPHLPARGVFPPSLWGNFIIKDVAEIRVPPWTTPGTYELTVSIGRVSTYPNLVLKDLLRDDDRYSGVTVGDLVIQ